MNESYKYLLEQGFSTLFDLIEETKEPESTSSSISGLVNEPFKIQFDDLARIHKLIINRKPFTTLEFGVGFSTIIIADALMKNKNKYEKIEFKPAIRNSKLFKHYSVDTSNKWISNTKNLIKNFNSDLLNFIEFKRSNVEIGTHLGQLCHFYNKLPDIVPEFIYLDGPHPKEVNGNINGLTFQCDERTVMSADILLMESTLLPGSFILVDGRTNNARFLKNNFKRNFKYLHDPVGDISTFELIEEPLGKYNYIPSKLY